MSTKTEPGAFDGMERAEPDEPVFTLRAHDVLAAPLVHEWVRQRREAIIHDREISDEKRDLELIQCREAEEVAFAMTEWRDGVREVEVQTEEAKPGYGGHTHSAEELAAKVRYDTVKGASGKLHNALSEATDAADSLEPYGFGIERAIILRAADHMKAIANHVGPQRGRSYSVTDPEPEPFEPGLLETSLQGYLK